MLPMPLVPPAHTGKDIGVHPAHAFVVERQVDLRGISHWQAGPGRSQS